MLMGLVMPRENLSTTHFILLILNCPIRHYKTYFTHHQLYLSLMIIHLGKVGFWLKLR